MQGITLASTFNIHKLLPILLNIHSKSNQLLACSVVYFVFKLINPMITDLDDKIFQKLRWYVHDFKYHIEISK